MIEILDYKFGIQQDKTDSEQLQILIIEVLMEFLLYMILLIKSHMKMSKLGVKK